MRERELLLLFVSTNATVIEGVSDAAIAAYQWALRLTYYELYNCALAICQVTQQEMPVGSNTWEEIKESGSYGKYGRRIPSFTPDMESKKVIRGLEPVSEEFARKVEQNKIAARAGTLARRERIKAENDRRKAVRLDRAENAKKAKAKK